MDLSVFEQDELLALIRQDMNKKNYDSALEKVKVVLSRERVPVEVLSLAGRIYAMIGLFERARIAFGDFVERSPGSYLELFQLGMVEKDLGNYEKAIEIWTSVLEIEQNYPEALFYLGDICIQLTRIEEARAWLLQLLETAPDDSEFIPMADQLLNRIKAH